MCCTLVLLVDAANVPGHAQGLLLVAIPECLLHGIQLETQLSPTFQGYVNDRGESDGYFFSGHVPTPPAAP
jgi:hypothetical protein